MVTIDGLVKRLREPCLTRDHISACEQAATALETMARERDSLKACNARQVELIHEEQEMREDAENDLTDVTKRAARMREALTFIETLDVFPEPDLMKARDLLEDGGMCLDAVSAHNMRHVITKVWAMLAAREKGE